MRIAIVYPLLDPIGGAELTILRLAKGLAEKGHKVVLYTSYYARDTVNDFISPLFDIKELFSSRAGNNDERNILEWLKTSSRLSKQLLNYDIINPHGTPAVIWIYLANMFTNMQLPPVVWYCQEPLRTLHKKVMDRFYIIHKIFYSKTMSSYLFYRTFIKFF